MNYTDSTRVVLSAEDAQHLAAATPAEAAQAAVGPGAASPEDPPDVQADETVAFAGADAIVERSTPPVLVA